MVSGKAGQYKSFRPGIPLFVPSLQRKEAPMKKRRLTGLLCAFALLCVLALPALGSSGGTTV